jgi:cytidylate kinase
MATDALVVSIDGPAGSGKSTLARALAKGLGPSWAYLDTGAMYRAVTLAALRRGVALDDAVALAALAAGVVLSLSRDGRVVLDGEDVTAALRTPEVNAAVSLVAANAAVRQVMVRHQRAFAAQHGKTVAEGRDIGTVVFPDAVVKIWLDASPAERASRRAAEMEAAGGRESAEGVRESIERRDRLDRERAVAPLVRAAGAVSIDTTGKTPEQVLAEALAAVQSRVPPPAGR